ncbi:hypothetical protein ONE63_007454 [Megalurothrips usitatus]|uniref:Uncharacterized protein n=1 Tax=Megalurothrips usitatus TaxID=439358 RepID=A0AAV7XS00_9NEOP|nr:hypothetical protein ONE63_007454 [Megalurothrips usitatus]
MFFRLSTVCRGHHSQTVYTLTQPPSPGPPFLSAGVPTYPGGLSYYPHYMGPGLGLGHGPHHPRSRYPHRQQRQQRQQKHVPTLPSDERLRRERRQHRGDAARNKPAKPKPVPVTEADVARTYTGLDRRIAEEFIMAMDHGLHRPGRQQQQADDTDATRVD